MSDQDSNSTNPGDTDLDGVQGADEQQTEPYTEYGEGAAETATQQPTKSGSGAAGSASGQAAAIRFPVNDNLEEAIQYAKKYLEDLLSFFGLNTDVHATTEDDVVIELDVPSTHLNGFLIGVAGDTLRSLQQVIGSALKNQGFAHSRVNIDVAGYKKQRAERIAKQAEVWFKEVKDSGQSKALEPMNAADRRIVHKVAGEWGIATESVGFGRERHVVLKPSSELSRPSAEADDGEAAQKSTAGKPEGAEDAPAEKVEEPADQSPAEE